MSIVSIKWWAGGLCVAWLCCACASPSGRISSSMPGTTETVSYSNYFESKMLVANKVQVHLIVTLGKERLPEGYRSSLSWTDRKIRDQIEVVEEIYLSNQTDVEVTVNALELSYYNNSRVYIDEPISIAPGTFIKTKAYVGITSVYRAARTRNLNITVNGYRDEFTMQESRTLL